MEARVPTGKDQKPMQRRWLAMVGYTASVVLVLSLIPELVTLGAGVVNLSDIRYRFGLEGVLITSLPLPLLGLMIAAGLAAYLRHRPVLLLVSILAALGTLGLGLASALLALDAIQLRAVVPTAARPGYVRQVTMAFAIGVPAILIMFSIAIASLRAFRVGRKPSSRRRPATSPIVGAPTTEPKSAHSQAD